MTTSETALWQRLRLGIDGYRFKAQVPLRGYVVDFYCSQLQLVVEVDGSSHRGREQQDWLRDDDLRANHFAVLRLPSKVVLEEIETALALLRTEMRRRATVVRRPPRRRRMAQAKVETCRHGNDALVCGKCKLVEQVMRQQQQTADDIALGGVDRRRGSGRGRYSTTPGMVSRPPSPPNTISKQDY